MNRLAAWLACWAVMAATLVAAFQGHAQDPTHEWPATREDRSSIIVVLEPEPGLEGHTMAITLSEQAGAIDATLWHQTSQPFVKQYLVQPGSYVVQGSASSEPIKLDASAGEAAILELQVEKSSDEELSYGVSVHSLEEYLDLGEAQARVFEALAAHQGAPQVYLSSLWTEGHDLEFALEPLAEYIPGLPWPIPPAPNPPTPPSPTPQDGSQ